MSNKREIFPIIIGPKEIQKRKEAQDLNAQAGITPGTPQRPDLDKKWTDWEERPREEGQPDDTQH